MLKFWKNIYWKLWISHFQKSIDIDDADFENAISIKEILFGKNEFYCLCESFCYGS